MSTIGYRFQFSNICSYYLNELENEAKATIDNIVTIVEIKQNEILIGVATYGIISIILLYGIKFVDKLIILSDIIRSINLSILKISLYFNGI